MVHDYWADIGAIDETRRISDSFDPIIRFTIADPTYSEDVLVDVLIKELETGLITRLDAIKRLNPEFTNEEAENYLRLVRRESMATRLDGALSFMDTAQTMMQPMVEQEIANQSEAIEDAARTNTEILEEEDL